MFDKKKYSLHDFALLSVFGYGNYSKVALVRKKEDSKIYAMKVIKKEGSTKSVKRSHAYYQKEILSKVSHPFVIRLHTTFQDKKRLFFILDYCPGGELFGLIRRMRRLSQENCRFYAAQVLLALEYLHSIKIIYRDLKPENFVLDKDGYLRIIDFGLSYYHNKASILTERDLAGTAYFLPPQAFDKEIQLGYESDWWSFGSLIFQMIMGFPPFFTQTEDMSVIINKIKTKEPPLQMINSEPLRNFLKLLLQKNPKKRLGYHGATEIKKHPWLIGVPWQKILRKCEKAPFVPSISHQTDVKFFEDDIKPTDLTPPQQDLQNLDKYPQFSLSWRSSSRTGSPVEICLNIEEASEIVLSCQQKFSNIENG